MIEITEKSACCGCGACQQKCPKQCIKMVEDQEGFLYPEVDKSICVDCHLCEKVCPFINSEKEREPKEILAVKNKNEEERMKSSSGGIFLPLAREIIRENGVVFGAVFDDEWQVKIDYAETIEEVYPMMGSKYVQARVDTAFRDAERFLKDGRKVLFTGVPCQIAGLKHYLQKDYDNLLTMDVICHGVPSPGVWRKYLKEKFGESARRAAAGKNTVLCSSLNTMPVITGIEFRDKTFFGWKKYSFVVRCSSADKADENSVLWSVSLGEKENYFMRGFLADIYLRPSCYACRCKGGKSNSDITVGDFWNLQSMMPDFDDNVGVSIAMIHSEKGKEYFERLDFETREATIENLHGSNPSYFGSTKAHWKRDLFYEMYNNDAPIAETLEKCLYLPMYKRAEKFMFRCIRYAGRKIKKLIK